MLIHQASLTQCVFTFLPRACVARLCCILYHSNVIPIRTVYCHHLPPSLLGVFLGRFYFRILVITASRRESEGYAPCFSGGRNETCETGEDPLEDLSSLFDTSLTQACEP
jgi:hypothetical protein